MEVRGQEKARMTKRDLEKASGRGDRKDWSKKKMPYISKVERWSAKNFGRNGMNWAISAKESILD